MRRRVRYMCIEEYVWRGGAGVESGLWEGGPSLICVWRCMRWCYPKTTNKCGANGVAGKGVMSNARVIFDSERRVHVGQNTSVGGNMAGVWRGAKEGVPQQVLKVDRNPWTLVVIVHEEEVNHFPGMAYFGGVFSGGEVNVQAMEYIPEQLFTVRATIDVYGRWQMRWFS